MEKWNELFSAEFFFSCVSCAFIYSSYSFNITYFLFSLHHFKKLPRLWKKFYPLCFRFFISFLHSDWYLRKWEPPIDQCDIIIFVLWSLFLFLVDTSTLQLWPYKSNCIVLILLRWVLPINWRAMLESEIHIRLESSSENWFLNEICYESFSRKKFFQETIVIIVFFENPLIWNNWLFIVLYRLMNAMFNYDSLGGETTPREK